MVATMELLDFSRPHLLRCDEEYDAAVREVDALLDLDPCEGSEAWERLEFLSLLVEDYEEKHHPIEGSSPREVVLFMLEQKGMTRADLDRIMGGKSRVSEFLNGKRSLSKSQIEAIRRELGIPADLLL